MHFLQLNLINSFVLLINIFSFTLFIIIEGFEHLGHKISLFAIKFKDSLFAFINYYFLKIFFFLILFIRLFFFIFWSFFIIKFNK